MTDKDEQVVEQEEQSSPATEESPELETNESPSEEVDNDFNEWAGNKGFDEEKLKNPDVTKALNMARNAEKFVGKKRTEEQEEPMEDIDKYIDDILGNTKEEPVKTEDVPQLNPETMTPQEKQAYGFLKAEATKAAKAAVAPALAAARKQEITAQYNKLHKEFGSDFTKNSVEILTKVKNNPGTSLEDATNSVLLGKLLKKSLSDGITKGKEIHKKEIAQQVETVKKTDASSLVKDFENLTSEQQREILIEEQNKGQNI